MPRYHVHLTITDDLWTTANPVITVTLDAHDDQMAQLNAVALIGQDIDYDICEIEEVSE